MARLDTGQEPAGPRRLLAFPQLQPGCSHGLSPRTRPDLIWVGLCWRIQRGNIHSWQVYNPQLPRWVNKTQRGCQHYPSSHSRCPGAPGKYPRVCGLGY